MLNNIKSNEIGSNKNLNNSFLSATHNELDYSCNIYQGTFFADSFNYFPITTENQTFTELYTRQTDNSFAHYFTDNFFDNFNNKKNEFKTFKDTYVLGSNPGDNYYSNLIDFLPRIFFINEEKVNIVVHRNLSNKFRNFIKKISSYKNLEVSFSFVDDNFYKFENSKIPQFFNLRESIKILKFFLEKIDLNINDSSEEDNSKIYLRREDSFYRKPINEADIIKKLRDKNFKIINPHQYEIFDQIKLFSKADTIVAPHGSSLANIIFCKEKAKIYELRPIFNKDYEKNLARRYKDISDIVGLEHSIIEVDSVNVEKHSPVAMKYINKQILNESTYYKNIIVKLGALDIF